MRNEESYSEDSSFTHSMVSSDVLKSEPQYSNSETPGESAAFLTCEFPENGQKFPDLLELSRNEENLINNNPFSTIPRKRSYKMKRTRHGSFGSESQSSLLPESSGDSCDSNCSYIGKTFFDKNASLPTSPSSLSQTPILNILDGSSKIFTQSPATLKYKSWELETFLKEYRNLQDQLYKMKKSCENLKEDNLKFREGKEPLNSIESVTISKMVPPVYLEDAPYKAGFLDQANNFESLYGESEFLEEDNNNSESATKNNSNLKSMLSNSEVYWSSGNNFLKTAKFKKPFL